MNENIISDFAFVSPNAIIGKGNRIDEGVIIRDGVILGDNNHIGPYCIIGEPAEKRGYLDEIGPVIIGNNNVFTKQVTIDAGTGATATEVGNGVLMLKNAHVGHGAFISDNVVLSVNSVIGGWTVVGESTNFGIGAVAHQRLDIPENCMIGMNAVVTKQSIMRPGFKYVGVPIKELGPNIRT
jgi:UDP-N-acetylglucosamine acyltransferase